MVYRVRFSKYEVVFLKGNKPHFQDEISKKFQQNLQKKPLISMYIIKKLDEEETLVKFRKKNL